ncbi:hypothetical protein ABRZ00_12830 [Castellaniella ginsengisoli]|uniref:Replicative helicase inhibitor G39P N-terminal domain-containing protein n=1 Tax=Castellaniella ginsengisoli TaxID=546114 RepID=A0AB39DJJ9_9BURK
MTTTAPVPLPLTWATKLIERLHLLYGTRFSQAWEGIDKAQLAQAWAEELAGFTGEELATGLAACKARPWPPTLPEFIVLCRPPIQPEVAFHEAVQGLLARQRGERGAWSHPAIFHAAVAVGAHDMLHATYGQLQARWGRALADILARGSWEPIPDAHQALTAPRKTEAGDREAANALRAIGAGHVLKPGNRDPRDWARRILANPKGRTQAIVEMAKRALEQHQEVVA